MGLFEQDEFHGIVNPEWSCEELLSKAGVFKLTHVCQILDINQPALRKLLNEETKSGKDTYALYGLKKEQGGWYVRMKVFRHIFAKIKDRVGSAKRKLTLQKLPKEMSRVDFFKLTGTYKLADVMELNHLPYSYDQTVAMVKRLSSTGISLQVPQNPTGCWLDSEKSRFWLCDFQPFLAFIVSMWRDIPLNQAKLLIAEENAKT